MLDVFLGDEVDGVAVAAHDAGFRRHVVGENPVAGFANKLLLGVLDHMLGFRGEADHEPRAICSKMRNGREDVGIFNERKLRRELAALFDLFAAVRRGPPVRNRSREHRDIGGQWSLDPAS